MAFWIVAGVVIIAAVIVLRNRWRVSGASNTRSAWMDAQARASALPPSQQVELAQAARETALTNYATNFTIAKSHGKDDAFAHAVAVLSAVKAVLAPENSGDPAVERMLQGETVPFNRADMMPNGVAIAEYLVWKFLPAYADASLFGPVLERFRDEVIASAEHEDDPDKHVFTMLYSMRFDWQRWLSERTALTGSDLAV